MAKVKTVHYEAFNTTFDEREKDKFLMQIVKTSNTPPRAPKGAGKVTPLFFEDEVGTWGYDED